MINLSGRTLLIGFVAGALSVVVFHQGMVFLLYLMKVVPNAPWNLSTIKGPVPIPTLVNQMFWGGIWGIGFAALAGLIPIANNILRGAVYGLLGPYFLGNAILVPLFKGGPMFWGLDPTRMIAGALIGASFGAGVAIISRGLSSR
jgi:hypothetical protein